jgi:hypothetical protein
LRTTRQRSATEIFDPKSHLAPFPKNSVFPTTSNDFVSSSVDQTSVIIQVIIIRWVFRIDAIVDRLESIRDELRKQNAEWPQIQNPKPSEDLGV